MATQVTSRMHKAAPEICQQIDALRTERRAVVDHHYYLKNRGKEEEAAEAQQRNLRQDDSSPRCSQGPAPPC